MNKLRHSIKYFVEVKFHDKCRTDITNAVTCVINRHDICAENLTQCGLMGLAYVAAACTGDKPCAINEDSGLVLGIVVAHEMGHV